MKNAAEINRHVLVYHRGVGVDKVSGPFVLEKASAEPPLVSMTCGVCTGIVLTIRPGLCLLPDGLFHSD